MTTRWTPRWLASEVGRRAKHVTSACDAETALPSTRSEPPPDPVPTVSVILPIYNVERYLAECLDSIVGQSYRDFEIVVVDDGSLDRSRQIAEEYARSDDRIQIVTRDNGGLGAARNTGVEHARGEFITFVDSDDRLAPDGLAALLESATRTGADIVVGSVLRFDELDTWKPAWVDNLHAEPRTRIAIDDCPELLRNNYTWNKLFRRDFWAVQARTFREGVAYEDQPLVTQLYIAASAIDVLPDVVYHYRRRGDTSSISQQTATLKDLQDRISAWRLSRQEFSATASRRVYEAWLKTLFDAHFQWYLRSPGTADLAYWAALRDVIVDLTDNAPAWIWEATAPECRVAIELARRNRRADLQEFIRQEGHRPRRFPAKVVEGGVRHELPFSDDPDLDSSLFLRRRDQLGLSHSLQGFGWRDGATMYLKGWAYIRYVDLVGRDSTTTLVLRNRRTGIEHTVPATRTADPGYRPPDEDDWIDYTGGAFEAVVSMDDVVGVDRRDGDVWDVRLRVETIGYTVEDAVSRVRRSSSAGVPYAGALEGGDLLTVSWQLHEPFRLVHRAARVEAVDVELSGRTLHGRVFGPHSGRARFVKVVSPGVPTARARIDGGVFAIDVPDLAVDHDDPGRPRRAQVIAELESGEELPLVRHSTATVEDVQLLDRTALAVECTRVNELGIVEWCAAAYADAVEVTSDGVARIEGRAFGPKAGTVAIRLTSKKTEVVSKAVALDEGRYAVELGLTYEAHRYGEFPLPAVVHDMTAQISINGSGQTLTVPLLVSRELNDALPVAVATDRLEGRIERGPHNKASLSLVRPLRGAAGRCRQNRLRSASGVQFTTGQRRGLLIRSYFGESATDSGLGLQRELQRRGADIDIYWSVQDHSIPVPDGVIPVIQNSFEWYGLLNTVKYYLDNMYQPYYHQKPDGQVIIQTFHGYPFKTMGHPHWEQQRFSRAQIESYDARTREWDYLVSPASYATPLLKRDFAYAGDILEIGYPRNDILFAPESGRIRSQVRRSLGIGEHQRAVLYAPTFRDYLSPDDNRAAMVDFFDLDKAVAALGDDYVILVRGHAFNARTAHRVGDRAGVVDVTDYPRVSDLYLAADAAVVDYSSLRFDFGLTGKPMIFHVPDLDHYKSTRGWLFDFEPTAPGPLASTTDDVVSALLELDSVAADYRDAYNTFRHAYLDLEDGNASARLVDAVFVPRGDAPPA